MALRDVILYPYQQVWLRDRSRFKIGMWARQTGKTFTCTAEIVLDCIEAEARGERRRWVILSRGERQAREAMEEGVKLHLNATKVVFEEYEYDWEPDVRALEVRLPGGSRITALPANPDTARGFSASVLLDEFAFHQNARAIWRALFPVISAGHRIIRIVSTPNGKGNVFYELMTAGRVTYASPFWLDSPAGAGALERPLDRWRRYVIDIYHAVEQGLPRDIDELREALLDPDAWAQEYELQWVDEASAWLPYDLIDAVEHPEAGDPGRYQGGPCFVGVDIAARRDLFVVWVLEQVGDVLWTREIIEGRQVPFAEQLAILDDVFRRYHVVRCCMDQTGMGEMMVEMAQRRFGTLRVEGVLFTPPAKLDLATRGREAFEDRRVRIPQGRPELRADLHSLQRTTGPSGAPRFVAEREGGSHADRTWALFLAISAAATGSVRIDYRRVGRPRLGASGMERTGIGFGTVRRYEYSPTGTFGY